LEVLDIRLLCILNTLPISLLIPLILPILFNHRIVISGRVVSVV
jgi:hypothetical protein